MVAISRRKRLNLPLAPVAAGALAIVVALIFALLPAGILEQMVLDSGIAALVPAAEPPLGLTARAILILIVGGGLGIIAWFTLFLLVGARTVSFSGKSVDDGEVPVLRRADAHPDAPARRPVFANQDLGTPFLEVRARAVHVVAEDVLAAMPETAPDLIEDAVFAPAPAPLVERDLPADLDMPLAAFDPDAIPDEPIEWFTPPAPTAPSLRRPVFDASERFETFELTPIARPAVEPIVDAAPLLLPDLSLPEPDPKPEMAPRQKRAPDYDSSASIHALLDRLEKGVTRRAPAVASPAPPPQREESLQLALVSLRRMAMRGA
jgi:hypothetical protein